MTPKRFGSVVIVLTGAAVAARDPATTALQEMQKRMREGIDQE